MISIQGRDRLRREHPSVTFFDFSLPPKLGNQLSNQPAGPLEAKLSVIIIFATTFAVPKYTKEDLQEILKSILEAQAPTTSKKPWIKPLKARFPDV